MSMQKSNVQFIVKSALIAALYAVLTLALGPISFGNMGIEFRISEALTILPIFTFSAVPGLFCGCIIANLIGMAFSTLGIVDVVFGSLATLIAALLTYFLRKITIKGLPFLSLLAPVIMNAIIIGLELKIILPDVFPSFLYAFYIIGIGEVISVFLIGVPLFYIINKTKALKTYLSE